MRLPKRGEKGFTLIELLIVVAILGVLAAVVIPNVGRFMGRGEEEARRVEFNTVRTAVTAMMVENDLTTIPNPENVAGGTATQNMGAFPDSGSVAASADKLTDPEGYAYLVTTDKDGYILYGHDITGAAVADPNPTQIDINTVSTQTMTYFYTCETSGEIQQWDDASMTNEYKY